MKKYWVLMLIFIFSLIQGAFGGPNLVLFFILFLAGWYSSKKVIWLAFFSGILLDLATGAPLGSSSFRFLILSYLLIVLSRRFNLRATLFL